jgi:hypothetical protein
MTTNLGGHMLMPLEKMIEKIAAVALHVRVLRCALMTKSEAERPIQCRSNSISSESYGELGHHT